MPEKVRTRASVPAGSAYGSRWQGSTSREPWPLASVRPWVQARLPKIDVELRGGHQRGLREQRPRAAGPRSRRWRCRTAARSRLGRTPAASVTRAPLTRNTATAAIAPTVVCVRRRAAPGPPDDRRPREPAVHGRRARAARRRRGCPTVGTSRIRVNSATAFCSSRSASSSGSPISRAICAIETLASWVSSSALRWRHREPAEDVEGLLDLGVEALVAVPQPGGVPALRVPPRVRADRGLAGRRAATTLRQWCQASTNASRTAARDAPRSPVRAYVCSSSRSASLLVELVERVGIPHDRDHGTGGE